MVFPDISFCFKTNPSTSCQGRALFKRICTRPYHSALSNSPSNRLLLGRAGSHLSLDAPTPEFTCWSLLLDIVHANLKLSYYFFFLTAYTTLLTPFIHLLLRTSVKHLTDSKLRQCRKASLFNTLFHILANRSSVCLTQQWWTLSWVRPQSEPILAGI